MNVLALVTDAFGGHGGIALYNRNILSAVCEHPKISRVVVIPRVAPNDLEPLPTKLEFRLHAKDSKARFLIDAGLVLATGPRFDLIIVSHMHLLPVAEVARRVTGAHVMLLVYGVEAWTQPSAASPYLLEKVNTCVSIRHYTLERMGEWANMDKVRPIVLENAIDLGRYGLGEPRRDLVEKYGLDDKRVLLTLGRLDNANFGADEIIEVLADLVREIPNLVYLVVGGGTHEARLRTKAARLGVSDHVVFTGMIGDDEKADHYRLADAFAMPGSHPIEYDRYPLRFVFLEAMACGLPVVASRPEELADLAQSPLPNIYVDPTNREDLKRGLLEALARGRGEIPPELERYSYPSFRGRLHGILDEVSS